MPRKRLSVTENQKKVKNKDVILVKQESDPNFFLVRFSSCGHEEVKLFTSLIKHNGGCSVCREAGFAKEAEEKGLRLLGEANTGKKNNHDYRRYEFVKCKHQYDITISGVRNNNNVNCRVCNHEHLSSLCKSLKFNFIEVINGDYISASCDTCGTLKRIQRSNLKRNTVSCVSCNNSAYNRNSYLYLFKINISDLAILKLGHSNNLYLRHNNYGLPEGYTVEILFKKLYDTKKDAMFAEKEVAKEVKSFRLPVETAKKYLTNGFTECYDIKFLSKILLKLKGLK